MKAIPTACHGGMQCCEMLRILHFIDNQLIDGGEVIALHTDHTSLPQNFLVMISVRGWVNSRATECLEGFRQSEKNSMASSGIEPMTFQF
jgi:hypothetical protein